MQRLTVCCSSWVTQTQVLPSRRLTVWCLSMLYLFCNFKACLCEVCGRRWQQGFSQTDLHIFNLP
jgi:hypothetical protein